MQNCKLALKAGNKSDEEIDGSEFFRLTDGEFDLPIGKNHEPDPLSFLFFLLSTLVKLSSKEWPAPGMSGEDFWALIGVVSCCCKSIC
jgi:hypothetical protein